MKRPSVKELEKRVAALEAERAELLRRLAAIEARSWPQYMPPPEIRREHPMFPQQWPIQQPPYMPTFDSLNTPMCCTQGGKI